MIVSRHDALMCAALSIAGGAVAVLFLFDVGYVFFYQTFTPELVYYACGHGFLHPDETPPALLDFLFGKSVTFDCSGLAALQDMGPAGLFARMQLYLSWSVAGLWRLSSVSYRSLWPLVAILAGSYVGGCFALLRLFFPRGVATAGSLILLLSPVAVSMIGNLRDYSKAPFFIWALVFLISAARRSSWRETVLLSSLAGATAGLGFGFRSDLVLLAPVGISFLALAVRGGWQRRSSVIGSFIALSLLVAAPIFAAKTTISGGGALMMEGMSEPFRVFLALEPAPYMLGWRYSDELTLSSIAADERSEDPGWDANEGPAVYSVSQAVRRSSGYLLQWLPWFAGDVATRALKSGAWVIGFPALVAQDSQRADPGGVTRSSRTPSRLLDWLYDLLGQSWFPPLAAIGALVFVWRIAVLSPREAFCMTLMLAVLCGYPSTQFSVRHLFHLEFVWIASCSALLLLPFEWRKLASTAPLFVSVSVLVAIFSAIVYGGLLAYQDHALRRELQSMIALRRSAIATTEVFQNDVASYLVPIPEEHRALVESAADSMTDKMPEIANQWDVRAEADRLLLTLGGPNCPASTKRVSLFFNYAKRTGVWQPLDHTFVAEISQPDPQSSHTLVIVPAFYRPTQHLQSIDVSSRDAGCVEKIERIIGRTGLPLIFSAVLTEGWQHRALHNGFGGFQIPPSRTP